MCAEQGADATLRRLGFILWTRGQQIFFAKEQMVGIFGFVSHTLCLNYSVLLSWREGSR